MGTRAVSRAKNADLETRANHMLKADALARGGWELLPLCLIFDLLEHECIVAAPLEPNGQFRPDRVQSVPRRTQEDVMPILRCWPSRRRRRSRFRLGVRHLIRRRPQGTQ